uniref:hypothetical protein n=1 Tax=Salmonella sp. TaxID=599 RepID=UPI001CD9923C|nr:hypothetical protein [Salmonella sp.]
MQFYQPLFCEVLPCCDNTFSVVASVAALAIPVTGVFLALSATFSVVFEASLIASFPAFQGWRFSFLWNHFCYFVVFSTLSLVLMYRLFPLQLF